jgi:hypothetical protein
MKQALLIGFAALALMPVGAPAEELKRLFFSPAERLALDAQRRGDARRGAAGDATPIRVHGTLQTPRGRATVWINGNAIAAGMPDPAARIDARVDAPGVVSLRLKPDSQWVGAKAGVDLDPASGVQRDLLGGGAVRVRR